MPDRPKTETQDNKKWLLTGRLIKYLPQERKMQHKTQTHTLTQDKNLASLRSCLRIFLVETTPSLRGNKLQEFQRWTLIYLTESSLHYTQSSKAKTTPPTGIQTSRLHISRRQQRLSGASTDNTFNCMYSSTKSNFHAVTRQTLETVNHLQIYSSPFISFHIW